MNTNSFPAKSRLLNVQATEPVGIAKYPMRRMTTLGGLEPGWYVGNFEPEVPFLIGPFSDEQDAEESITDPLGPHEAIFEITAADWPEH